jgi:tRNA(Ile)-lysidine synthetase-like protein
VAGGWRALSPRNLPTSDPQPVSDVGPTPWEPARLQVMSVRPGDAGGPRPTGEGRGGGAEQVAFELPGAWRPPQLAIDPDAVPPGGRVERMALALPEAVADLVLRHRTPGDRVRTQAGTRRVADVLADACLPRAARATWPVVASGGRVVWVPGFVADGDVLAAGRVAPIRRLFVGRAMTGSD